MCPDLWMNSLICWISRRTLEQPVLMISSTSRRLPRKTCGLFDTGMAGDTDLVASLALGVPPVIDQTLLTLEGIQSAAPQPHATTTAIHSATTPVAEGQDAKLTHPGPAVMDWATDFLDPLGGLDDPLADDGLDAFINLDTLLMGEDFLDECDPTAPLENLESSLQEVRPIIELAPLPHAAETAVEAAPELSPLPVATNHQNNLPAKKTTPKSTSRKRKAAKQQAVKTSLFEIPAVSSPDHDYSSKQQRLSSPGEAEDVSPQTATTSGATATSKVSKVVEDKQAVRRMKNNVASKRSREQRKAKFVEMDQEAEYLTEANEKLRAKIVELEKTAKEMKALLVAKMAGKA